MGLREYAVGDIHGRSDLLDAALDAIEDYAGDDPADIILLGDYVDRGPDSKGVIQRVMAGPRRLGDTMQAIIGNHEELLLRAVDGERGGLETFLRNGGTKTLASYSTAAALSGDTQSVHRSHVAWMRDLPTHIVSGHRFYTHAGVHPERPLSEQRRDDLLWIRNHFLISEADFGAHVVHGHTVTREVVLRPNRTGLDIGAFRSGRLAVGVFDPRSRGGPEAVIVVSAIGEVAITYFGSAWEAPPAR